MSRKGDTSKCPPNQSEHEALGGFMHERLKLPSLRCPPLVSCLSSEHAATTCRCRGPFCSCSACSGAAAPDSSLQGTAMRPVPRSTAGSPPSLPSIAVVAVVGVGVAGVGAAGAGAGGVRCSRNNR